MSCHLKDFQGTTNPNHVQSSFPQTCQQCHTTTTWANATFDHATTGFPLTGAHTAAAVRAVPREQQLQPDQPPTRRASVAIRTTSTGTNNPPHAPAGFSQTCTQCHTTALAERDLQSLDHRLSLDGRAYPLQCAQCHVNNNYKLTSGALRYSAT